MNRETLAAPTPPVGVIESLSRGFETIAGHPYLLLIPLLFDLMIWVGPRVNTYPVMETMYNEIWLPALQTLEANAQEDILEIDQIFQESLKEEQLSYLPALGGVSLLGGAPADVLPFAYSAPIWNIRSAVSLIGLTSIAGIFRVLIGCLYLVLIATVVREGRLDLLAMLRRLPFDLFWLVLLIIVTAIILIVVFTPFFLLATGFGLFSAQLMLLTVLLGWVIMLWVAMYLIFSVHGILINRRNVIQAVWDSVRLVRWNLGATLLLVLLIIVISSALNIVWNMPPRNSWLTVLSISGHAFISSSLVAASFIYFKDRYRHWQQVYKKLRTEWEKQRLSHP